MVSIASGVSSDENTVKKVGNLRTSKYNSPIYQIGKILAHGNQNLVIHLNMYKDI